MAAFDGRTLVQVELRKTQRNDIFKAIQGAGFSPEEFGFEWAAGADESIYRHLQSGARFVLRGVAGDYSTWWSAGDEPVWEREKLSWFWVMEQVGFWLSTVKQDVETPTCGRRFSANGNCSRLFPMRPTTTRRSPPPSAKRLASSFEN